MADNLTPEQRRLCMSRNKGCDTRLEFAVRSRLHKQGYRFRKHVTGLPGRPDIVFPRIRLVVFVDGDFWHGYRLPRWQHVLTNFWRKKIRDTRLRDARNIRRLRRRGWSVIRIWEHQVEADIEKCLFKIVARIQVLTASTLGPQKSRSAQTGFAKQGQNRYWQNRKGGSSGLQVSPSAGFGPSGRSVSRGPGTAG